MCVLNDRMLSQWARFGGLTPFDPECINPASVDLKWSGKWCSAGWDGWSIVFDSDELTIEKGKFYLLSTLEHIVIPAHLCATLMSKSTPARNGLEHLHAGFFDPGFPGQATLEVFSVAPWPITIRRGQRLVQLKLERMAEEPLAPYNKKPTSHYNWQQGPTPGWK